MYEFNISKENLLIIIFPIKQNVVQKEQIIINISFKLNFLNFLSMNKLNKNKRKNITILYIKVRFITILYSIDKSPKKTKTFFKLKFISKT